MFPYDRGQAEKASSTIHRIPQNDGNLDELLAKLSPLPSLRVIPQGAQGTSVRQIPFSNTNILKEFLIKMKYIH